jgi:RNA polymerase sigma-70 factor (ECF subfamily)
MEVPEGAGAPADRLLALWRAHARALRAFVASRVRDPATVEDICQETFLAALARGLPDAEAAPWLFAVARNKVLKHVRDRKPTAPNEASAAVSTVEPGAVASESEERARVGRAVAALDDDLREVIVLRYEGGLDYREIAERLAVPVSTIQGRLKRAREALRRALDPVGRRP